MLFKEVVEATIENKSIFISLKLDHRPQRFRSAYPK